MRSPPPALGRAVLRVAAALVVAAAATAPAAAAPGEGVDPLAQMLADKGALDTPVAAAEVPRTPIGVLRQVHERTSEMAAAALDFTGIRYRRGGSSIETGFDCSGFTRHVFETSLGMVLPRRVDEQATAPGLVAVQREDLQPGDLVFFNTLRRTFSHVGIYLGANRFIHAPRSGAIVRTEDMRFAYWAKRFTGARRLATTAAAAPAAAPEPLAPVTSLATGS